jgi:predicted NUDIX family NTP pyrophosphohydrolase
MRPSRPACRANRSSSDVSVLLGGAAGGFTGPTSFPTGFFSNSVAVGNFNANADQDPDLAVANAFDGTVSVLLGGPGGGFTGPTDFAAGSPYVVAVGDFNGDGDPDLVVADHVAGDLSVLVGGPGGSFSGPTTVATGTGTAAVAVGEFNQDGDPDLAVRATPPTARSPSQPTRLPRHPQGGPAPLSDRLNSS